MVDDSTQCHDLRRNRIALSRQHPQAHRPSWTDWPPIRLVRGILQDNAQLADQTRHGDRADRLLAGGQPKFVRRLRTGSNRCCRAFIAETLSDPDPVRVVGCRPGASAMKRHQVVEATQGRHARAEADWAMMPGSTNAIGDKTCGEWPGSSPSWPL